MESSSQRATSLHFNALRPNQSNSPRFMRAYPIPTHPLRTIAFMCEQHTQTHHERSPGTPARALNMCRMRRRTIILPNAHYTRAYAFQLDGGRTQKQRRPQSKSIPTSRRRVVLTHSRESIVSYLRHVALSHRRSHRDTHM